MKTTVSEHDFIRAFEVMGRQNQFSRAALQAIFEYMEDYERDTGEEVELDVIALCCEWAEYDSALDAASEYGWEPDAEADDPEADALDWLEGQTQVRSVEGGGVVLVQF